MFDQPYVYQKVSAASTMLGDPTHCVYYRFKAAKRTYFVTLEVYSFNLAAIKYCDIKDKDARSAYKKIFNDHDAIRVITTCLYIMLEWWDKHPTVSFAFRAMPRSETPLPKNAEQMTPETLAAFLDARRKARYSIYSYAMVNLFAPEDFEHKRDSANDVYVLLNRQQPMHNKLMDKLVNYMANHMNLVFDEDVADDL